MGMILIIKKTLYDFEIAEKSSLYEMCGLTSLHRCLTAGRSNVAKIIYIIRGPIVLRSMVDVFQIYC